MDLNLKSGNPQKFRYGQVFPTANQCLGTHHIEMYNPVLRAVNTFMRSVIIAAGKIAGGLVLERSFPISLSQDLQGNLTPRRITVSFWSIQM